MSILGLISVNYIYGKQFIIFEKLFDFEKPSFQ